MDFWDVKDLSKYLKIKSSTIYAWTAQGKIPHIKIHGLVRFKPEEIDTWLETFRSNPPPKSFQIPKARYTEDVDTITARAKREVLNNQNRRPSRKIVEKKSDDRT